MIWIWIGSFFARLRWILVPPPENFRPVRKIDVNAPCPICGHGKGRLSVGMNGGKPACQHNCLVCGGTFFGRLLPSTTFFLQSRPPQAAAAPEPAPSEPAKKG